MKNKSKSAEYNKYKDMAICLLGNKVLSDFIAVGIPSRAEPEHFYEEWMDRNVIQADDEMLLWTWRYFITKLIDYRRIQKP